MASSSFHDDPNVVIVADTSAIININATGAAEEILTAVPNAIVVAAVIPSELEDGRRKGRRDADLLQSHITSGLIEVVSLDDLSNKYFEELVIGSAAATLDDGEAATIAYAITHNAVAIVDERKATRLCSERFPTLRAANSVDILSHPSVVRKLGSNRLKDAVFGALKGGRMRVFPEHLGWVVGVIGPDRAAQCSSLPLHARAVR
jgi:predicted nucleic acid-binding protein